MATTIELSEALKTVPMADLNEALGRGWEEYADSTYTVGSPLVIANTTTQLPCNGLGAGTNITEKPIGQTAMWDTVLNKINAIAEGDSCDLRIQFKGKCSTISAWFDFKLDIGGAVGVIFSRTLSATKGANTEVSYSIGVPIFELDTFLANGGIINLDTTGDGTTLSIYDIQVFIKRDYSGNGSRV